VRCREGRIVLLMAIGEMRRNQHKSPLYKDPYWDDALLKQRFGRRSPLRDQLPTAEKELPSRGDRGRADAPNNLDRDSNTERIVSMHDVGPAPIQQQVRDCDGRADRADRDGRNERDTRDAQEDSDGRHDRDDRDGRPSTYTAAGP
jgi:hypothetical protein